MCGAGAGGTVAREVIQAPLAFLIAWRGRDGLGLGTTQPSVARPDVLCAADRAGIDGDGRQTATAGRGSS